MRTITICSTENGWLVINGEPDVLFKDTVDHHQVGSFNSLDKAMGDIRKRIKAWHQPLPVAKP